MSLELRSPSSKLGNLQRYKNNELELIIDKETGEVFATQGMIAKLCKQESTTIRQFLDKRNVTKPVKQLPIKDSRGVIQLSKLYDEDAIYETLAKYKPELLITCAKAGIRLYLHRLVNLNFSSSSSTIDNSNLSVQLIMSSLNELHQKIDKQEHEIQSMQSSCIRLNKIETVLDKYSGLKEALDFFVENYGKEFDTKFSLYEWLEEKNMSHLERGKRIKLGHLVNGWIKLSCKQTIKEKYPRGYKLYSKAYEPILNLALEVVNS